MFLLWIIFYVKNNQLRWEELIGSKAKLFFLIKYVFLQSFDFICLFQNGDLCNLSAGNKRNCQLIVIFVAHLLCAQSPLLWSPRCRNEAGGLPQTDWDQQNISPGGCGSHQRLDETNHGLSSHHSWCRGSAQRACVVRRAPLWSSHRPFPGYRVRWGCLWLRRTKNLTSWLK